jgi:hypothetical protein
LALRAAAGTHATLPARVRFSTAALLPRHLIPRWSGSR